VLVSHNEAGVKQRRNVGDETVGLSQISRQKLALNGHTHSSVELRG
jgi:hypothetical protein